jgi:carbon-monoxide dehydrogenase medium subunit
MISPFTVLNPTTVPEAAAEMDRLGDAARIYAGGAELLLLMRQGLVEPDYLVNIKHVLSLHDIGWDGQTLRLGAAVTHRQLEHNALVHEHAPTLGEAERHIGNIRVRNQGTLGGNLCFADPHSDPGTALLVHDASVTVEGPGGPRSMPLDDFFVSTYETALDPTELLTEVQVAPLPSGWGWSFERIERFYRPTVNAAAAVATDDGHIRDVRLSVGCVGPRALRLHELEGKLQGLTFADAQRAIANSTEYLTEQLEPVSDLLGAADYKVHVTSVLLARALENALARRRDSVHD